MLEINGIPPKLEGQECEELICQQYWQQSQLLEKVDVLFIKVNGKWNQLYFENGAIFWRLQSETPVAIEQKEGDPFSYPFIDLGAKYDLRKSLITDTVSEQIPDGVRVTFVFEQTGQLILTCVDNRSDFKFIRH